MAIWQFDLYFVSEGLAKRRGVIAGTQIASTQCDELLHQNIERLPAEAINQLKEVLEVGKSWSESLDVFGDLESTCITCLKEQHGIIEIKARLDLRTITCEILVAILNFAKAINCLLLTDEYKVINPTLVELKDEIRLSSAYLFVKDPRGFIEGLE